MIDWKIYYGDGSTYSSEDGPAEQAPKINCQAVVQNHEVVGHSVEHTTDYYVWFDGFWRGVEIFGLWDYLSQPGSKVVLFGRWVPNDEYREFLNKALNDPEVPKKSAWLPGGVERRG